MWIYSKCQRPSRFRMLARSWKRCLNLRVTPPRYRQVRFFVSSRMIPKLSVTVNLLSAYTNLSRTVNKLLYNFTTRDFTHIFYHVIKMPKPVLRYTPKYEKDSFCKMIDFVLFHLIDWSNYPTHEGFLLFLPCDHHLSLSQCTCVVVDRPMIKNERYENRIEF